jgi:HlyD family secretion protein
LSDRLKWARRMLDKGYIARSQLTNEEFNERKAAFDLKKSRMDHDVFRRHTAPRILRDLEGKVFGAEAIRNYQAQRLQRNVDRQRLIERQIERCTIRAPHDGFVIYIYDYNRQLRIEEGMTVYQGQDLFYLPDLEHMEAMAMVHESVVDQVRPGMRARVRIEGLRDEVLEGRVTSVAQLPTQNMFNDLRYFYTEVVLDKVPRGVLPGMTAEVEIATDQRFDVLSIPIEAMAYEEGQEVCYVASEEGVERRELKVGQSTRDRIEVIEGLDEGEQIVLNPARYDEELETISPFDADETSRWAVPVTDAE